jgi:hypothetical protein
MSVIEYYEEFSRLLKREYGVLPVDVGVDRMSDITNYVGEVPVKELVEWLGNKYDLDGIRV